MTSIPCRRLGAVVLTISLLASAWGCSSDDGEAAGAATAGTGGSPEAGGGGTGGEGTTDAGVAACADDLDCAPPTPRCDVAGGACVECLAPSDCPAGERCDAATRSCAPGCDEAGDCAPGTVCDPKTQLCVGCARDGDCSPGTVCEASVCVPGCTDLHPCPAPELCCDSACKDTASDPVHCGGCGLACAEVANGKAHCAGGTCAVLACDAGHGDCNLDYVDGCEADLLTAPQHCGACGNGCVAANGQPACSLGSCAVGGCDPPYADCNQDAADGCEVDTGSSPDSCGSCGKICPAQGGTPVCASGVCTVSSCAPGQGDCDGQAANGCETPLVTLAHCGACGQTCDLAHASESCSTGSCALSGCEPGFADCDGSEASGCETPLDTTTDCGGCGVFCALANADETCASGICKLAGCHAGWGNCNGVEADGCEAELRTLQHCGACATPCDVPHAGETCADGTCTMTACSAGFGDCDADPANGCETPLTTASDCGACGQPCALDHAEASCASGTCLLGPCHAGYGNCDGDTGNGCETPLGTPSHCGGCGQVCSFPHAGGACASSTCQLGPCDAGWGNCDGQPANGCEMPLSTTFHCGACNTSCSLPHATTTCASGSCEVAQCDAGYGDCNGAAADGCEASINSLTHCGACHEACDLPNASEACVSESCQVTGCESGWGDCDAVASTGCETDLDANTMHCGGCGNACPGGANGVPTCASGGCGLACVSGYADCDANPGNGCETQLNSLAHCGACDTPCDLPNASESCTSGSCSLTACASGFANCDGNHTNGCETNLSTPENCGSCGNTCPVGGICQGGTCVACTGTGGDFADDFDTSGWTLTGDFGFYDSAPPSSTWTSVTFPSRAFGTDGNRSKPYPGGHSESSYARTKPLILPANLTFQSWHVDEGCCSYDSKSVRVSVNGGASWTTLVDCTSGPNNALPFCDYLNEQRDPASWDSISISTGGLAGQTGIVELAYSTGDGCCSFEQGWYIDDANFGTCP